MRPDAPPSVPSSPASPRLVAPNESNNAFGTRGGTTPEFPSVERGARKVRLTTFLRLVAALERPDRLLDGLY